MQFLRTGRAEGEMTGREGRWERAGSGTGAGRERESGVASVFPAHWPSVASEYCALQERIRYPCGVGSAALRSLFPESAGQFVTARLRATVASAIFGVVQPSSLSLGSARAPIRLLERHSRSFGSSADTNRDTEERGSLQRFGERDRSELRPFQCDLEARSSRTQALAPVAWSAFAPQCFVFLHLMSILSMPIVSPRPVVISAFLPDTTAGLCGESNGKLPSQSAPVFSLHLRFFSVR